jgi:hypothetical protein
MTQRVQGHQSAWKNHVPGDGEPCCPPVVVWNPDFIIPQGGVLGVAIEGVKLDNVVSVEVREAGPSYSGGVLPLFVSFGPFVPGVPPFGLDELPVIIDTTDATDGHFALLFTNECGCCAIAIAQLIVG